MDYPKYKVVEIYKSSRQGKVDFKNLRFQVTDGKNFFTMRPEYVDENSVRLRCCNSKNSCKVKIELKVKANIRKTVALLSTSSYTVVHHQVRLL